MMSCRDHIPEFKHHALVLIVLTCCFVLITPLTSFAEEGDVNELLAALTRGSEGDRIRAATRLYHLGQGDRGVRQLSGRLRSQDPDERCIAARLLGMLRSSRAVSSLVAGLGDEDWAVRRDSAEALGQIGDVSAATRLNQTLGDPHPRVRIAVVHSLQELNAVAALPGLLEEEGELEVRLQLVEAIASDSSTPATTEALRDALDDGSELVRNLAASYLVERGEVRAVEHLAQRLRLESVTARRETVEALGRASGEALLEARRLLVVSLEDPSLEVGLAAASSLCSLGDTRGAEFLRAIARSDAPPILRARALEMLERSARGETSER